MPADQPRFGKNAIDDLQRRVIALEKALLRESNKRPHLPLHDLQAHGSPFPQDGQVIVDYRGNPLDGELTSVVKYGYAGQWYPLNGADYEIKLYGDAVTTAVASPRFIYGIPRKLNGYKLVWADAFVSTVSSSGSDLLQLQIVGAAGNMLTTPITITTGNEFASDTGNQGVINEAQARIQKNQLLAISVTGASNSKGLGIILEFSV
jgi:hypothetical protein